MCSCFNSLTTLWIPVPNIRYEQNTRWASILHYVNTPGDNPPDSCHFEYNYSGKDVVNGLFNMTSQLQHYKASPPVTPEEKSAREDALRFFVHFMGDVHQPLHNSGKARGGNDAPAKWGRARTNLHRIWDGQLILVSPIGGTVFFVCFERRARAFLLDPCFTKKFNLILGRQKKELLDACLLASNGSNLF